MRITADQPVDNYPGKRVAELEGEITRLDKAMADVRRRIEKFVELRPQCCTIFRNGRPAVRIGALEQRDPTLRALESELDALVMCWHATLGEYVTLKKKSRPST